MDATTRNTFVVNWPQLHCVSANKIHFLDVLRLTQKLEIQAVKIDVYRYKYATYMNFQDIFINFC